MDFCSGSYSTAKNCMLKEQNKKLIRCDLDLIVISAAEPDLLSTSAS